jgi:hypothetical protein
MVLVIPGIHLLHVRDRDLSIAPLSVKQHPVTKFEAAENFVAVEKEDSILHAEPRFFNRLVRQYDAAVRPPDEHKLANDCMVGIFSRSGD